MAYEAVIYGKDGKAISDVRAEFDRGYLLNGYEQATFKVSALKEQARLDDFAFGNHLVITDDELAIWGGYFDTPQPWGSSGIFTMQAYSGERIFEQRPAGAEQLLPGTAGTIYRDIIGIMNSVAPWATLMRVGTIFEGGNSRQETVSLKKLYDDVVRIASRSGNDFYVEPVVENGILHYEGHWYAQRGQVKDFALEEGVNVEAKENVLEYQGDIWNYIMAYGNGATWDDRPRAIAYDQASIDKYGPRVYPLAVDSSDLATVQASADAFVAFYAWPRRAFNLTVGGKRVREDEKSKVFKILRIGDVVDLKMYSPGYDNGKRGVDTKVRILGMTHHGKKQDMDLIASEVRS